MNTRKNVRKTRVSANPISKLHIVDGDDVNAIVEAARGSRNKYKFDPETGLFSLHKLLPAGMVFPYDFGFIPGTKAQDGDPLDVLILMDEPAFCGCQVKVKLIGVIEAEQRDRPGAKPVRNDRLIGVASPTVLYKKCKELKDVDEDLLHELESFFVAYNKTEGREFKVLSVRGASDAYETLLSNTIRGKAEVQKLARREARKKAS